jgi:hypothetical protein
MIDHIFMLMAIIDHTHHYSLKVFYCFAHLWKEFHTILREAFLQRMQPIDISKALLTGIVRLYKLVLGHLHMAHRLSDFTRIRRGEVGVPPLTNPFWDLY